MDNLSKEVVDNLVNAFDRYNDIESNPNFYSETDAYLFQLFAPYAQSISTLRNIEAIELWMRETFPTISEDMIMYFEDILAQEDEEADEETIMLVATKVIIEELLDRIEHDPIINDVYERGDDVTPWAIRQAMAKDDLLKTLFTITDPKIIPITVIIDGRTFVHNMTENLAVAIMVGYNFVGQEHSLSLFGWEQNKYPYSDMLKINNYPMIIGEGLHSRYSAKIGDRVYSFSGPDFIQGILTAALWTGTTIPISELQDNGISITF